VYLRLIERTLAAGKRALVLVPEIGLTPQTGARIVRRLPGRRVAILHSGMTAAERHRAWATVARGEADVVLGARSAVFAPFPDGSLGLVVVDDVAIRRAQIAGCPIVLGSATPSLESWWNATRRGLATLHRMPHRAPGLRLPKVVIVDFNEERHRYRDRRVHLIGPTLRAGLRETLDAGGQAVLLLNRRGYANYIACTDPRCDWILCCDQCDAGMVCHRQRIGHADGSIGSHDYTRCHHCHAELRLPRDCPACGKRVSVFGLGTQRVEEELQRDFPDLIEGETLARVDADAMRGEGDVREVLDRFGAGRVRVVLGTQMIAKGLDFPNVRLVGVISADTALHLPDFRAAERTYQLVSQVAGRCGRGEHSGTAIIQTFQPQAPSIVAAARHDYEGFATRELADRERFGLPPVRRMARLVLRDAKEPACAEAARRLADELRRRVAEGEPVEIRGPAPCPIARIAGRYRFQIELFAATAGGLTRLLTALRNDGLLPIGEALAVDVDPVLLL
jgi:primosomal protein N' (replication factor Y)